MGVDPKYCKVTVHRASPPSLKASPPRARRQTVGAEGYAALRQQQHRRYEGLHPPQVQPHFSRAPPPLPPYASYAAAIYNNVDELQDDAADIPVLSEDEPLASSRRRAHTTTSMSTSRMSGRLSNRLMNPLSRMTLRWTEHAADATVKSQAAASSSTSASSTPEVLDTPPPMMDLANSFLDVDTDGSDVGLRPTLDDTVSLLLAGTPPIPAGLTLDMLPTAYETPPLPTHLRGVLLHNQSQQHDADGTTPLAIQSDVEDESESDYDEYDDDISSAATSGDYGEDPTNHSVDIDSIRQTREQAVATFEASMRAPNRMKPRFRTTEVPGKVGGSARNIRGLSSPPRMHSQVIRQRKATLPHGDRAGGDAATGTDHNNSEPPAEPMYHGQELHLAFKTSTGQLTQVQGHPKRRGGSGTSRTNPFSRRIRCFAIESYEPLEDGDTLRIIGHTTDGLLRGGDCISFARTDGTVLRMQKMTKKLTFSNKIDVRAKFIIAGVPDRTPVTSTSKFYLQSVYDRKKTVGFLPARRSGHPGCLAMYVYRKEDDKAEPIQFFKRHAGHAPLFWHHPQQWV
ncbi:hypothetical protein BBJ28_00001181 [Nothophytophthora sp. Chile5]|nr:hypothetical protein BBJ28_00001181 [Nothophytophthora sp. Chile5]